jgi:hypothetical protein
VLDNKDTEPHDLDILSSRPPRLQTRTRAEAIRDDGRRSTRHVRIENICNVIGDCFYPETQSRYLLCILELFFLLIGSEAQTRSAEAAAQPPDACGHSEFARAAVSARR